MVACLLALIVFSFLGIFSAKYRKLARQAFSCTFNMIRLRPCDSGMDRKLRSMLVAKLMHHNRAAAGFVFKHFKALSTIFVVLLLASTIYTIYGVYNLAVYGSCEPHSTVCIFNPGEITCGSQHCLENGCTCEGEAACLEPTFYACDGTCDCQEQICG